MGIFSNLYKSTDLVNGMADRLCVGMSEFISQNPERYAPLLRTMAIKCTGCSAQADCHRLQGRSMHLDKAPMYCVNKTTLDALRQR
ncbi:DUF6455 family protein [Sedimentitalea todarodis]|uniref:DUF6455 family protein n=1 Tax=Sedimentitalea todarodis TaxID=1631240 RepID=A0ABU3VBN3_9RHOB|nr:DUF6455 family protein [Sedimentitalea todarodis]MDU9003574.1 DUF6455 family protein [Sedimentitalea todarodis]